MSAASYLPGRCAAVAALLVLSPLLALLALLVKVSSRGPVLFRQERVGRGGERFDMLKFRTMAASTDEAAPQVTAAGDRRVTAVGRFLRSTKLDELPELLHIVRGEMAFVGPRPEVPRYVDSSEPLWERVLSVPPGLTDPATLRLRDEEAVLAQLAQRHGGDVERAYREVLLPYKLRTSSDYLERRTLLTDTGVLARTLWAVVAGAASPPLHEIERASRSATGR